MDGENYLGGYNGANNDSTSWEQITDNGAVRTELLREDLAQRGQVSADGDGLGGDEAGVMRSEEPGRSRTENEVADTGDSRKKKIGSLAKK